MESESENQNVNSPNQDSPTPNQDSPIQIDVDGVEVSNSDAAAIKRRLNSHVWDHFNIYLGPDKKQRCKCKKCGTTYACPSNYGTGNLIKHLEKCKKRDTRDIGQLLITRERGSVSLGTKTFDQDTFRELLVAAIAMHSLPFQFVEYEGFRALFQYLNENVQTISRNTCRSDVLRLYNREKERVKCMLQTSPGRISLTSDLWSSIISDGYLSLTAHFLDKDWILQKRILNYSLMPPPHTGVNLSEKIYSLLCEWGIEHKIFSMTLDNASSNIAFINLLISQLNIRKLLVSNGDYVHIRCCAHILNLVVQDGLKMIGGCLENVRESIKYLKGSQTRKERFKECAKNMAIECRKGLRQDCSTRWNSTFVMLDGAIYYRRAFCHLKLCDTNYTFCPSDEEWDKAEKIAKFLSVFYEITQIFSGSKYPTANLYFPVVAIAHLTLKDKLDCEDEFMRLMAAKMYDKFKKYWADFSTILAIACILDPRYKLSCVDFFYRKFYGADSIQFTDLKVKLFSLFDEYAVKASPSSVSASTQKRGDRNRCEMLFANEAADVMKELDEYELDESVVSAKKTQLELYLEEPKVDRKVHLDVLDFWGGNRFRYPELAAMACDILSIPITTVSSEAAFSAGGRVLNKYRTALLPENAETLICARDWLYGEKAAAELKIEELCEDILNLNLNNDESRS